MDTCTVCNKPTKFTAPTGEPLCAVHLDEWVTDHFIRITLGDATLTSDDEWLGETEFWCPECGAEEPSRCVCGIEEIEIPPSEY